MLLLDSPLLIESTPAPNRWRRTARAGGALDVRAGLRPGAGRPLAWRGLVRFPADRVHKAVVEALVPGALEPAPEQGEEYRRYAFESRSRRDRLGGEIGFRMPTAEPARKLVEQNGPLLIKAHYALWARAFAETDSQAGEPVSVTLSQFCDDLGYTRLQNGAHRPETKRQALQLLEALAALELNAEYHAPDARSHPLHGPLWRFHPLCEEPRMVRYAPGEWFADPAWRKYNHSVGLAGAGLLSLRPDRDRWAICIAAYLAALARMNGYRPLTLRVRTLLEKSGLLNAERRNPARMREMLERALERAEAVGVLGQWDWLAEDPSEPDMDAPLDLAALHEPASEWMGRRLLVRWPDEFQSRAQRLRPPVALPRPPRRKPVER